MISLNDRSRKLISDPQTPDGQSFGLLYSVAIERGDITQTKLNFL